jgi:chromosome segregation ATPase
METIILPLTLHATHKPTHTHHYQDRKYQTKLKNIERRIHSLQTKAGGIKKRCTNAENERDVLLTKQNEQHELHEIALVQLKEEYRSQLITSKSKEHNQKEVIATVKKNLKSLRIKYEGAMNKSNENRAAANQMLLRLESQLKEVTEALKNKNDDVRDYESR